MRAAVCFEFGQPFAIEDVSLAPPGPGEVRARIGAVAICHSDVIAAEGGWGGRLPVVWGHEAAGDILEVGEGVVSVAPGDRVVVTMLRHCGTCRACARGLHGSCETSFPLDTRSPIAGAHPRGPIAQGLGTGAFAEEVVVHESQVVGIDRDVDLAVASLLACGVITGYGAVANTAAMPAGADAVVIGTGGVGVNAVQTAALRGAARIVAVDLDDDKLAAARAFGATHGVNARAQDAVEAVREITDGRGADYVFVTVGVPAAFDQSYRMLAPGGTSVIVGVAADGARSSFDPVAFNTGSHRILGSKLACDIRRDIPEILRHYREGRFKLDELVSTRFGFEAINQAMAAAKAGRGLRNVVMLG